MATEIKCPNCGHQFEPTDSIREEVQRELRNKMTEWQKQQQQVAMSLLITNSFPFAKKRISHVCY